MINFFTVMMLLTQTQKLKFDAIQILCIVKLMCAQTYLPKDKQHTQFFLHRFAKYDIKIYYFYMSIVLITILMFKITNISYT